MLGNWNNNFVLKRLEEKDKVTKQYGSVYAWIVQVFITIYLIFMAGNHWSVHEELHVTLCSIQKYISVVGSCRIPQACPIAIKKRLSEAVNFVVQEIYEWQGYKIQ